MCSWCPTRCNRLPLYLPDLSWFLVPSTPAAKKNYFIPKLNQEEETEIADTITCVVYEVHVLWPTCTTSSCLFTPAMLHTVVTTMDLAALVTLHLLLPWALVVNPAIPVWREAESRFTVCTNVMLWAVQEKFFVVLLTNRCIQLFLGELCHDSAAWKKCT